ncbi:MAG: hypothetical protein JW384_01771 [Nitrosomonadaceae bacterium]|nr:hypothetical protein [Nitrosomonadaceae bacterium]
MEGHAPFPDRYDTGWMLDIVGEIIKKRIAEPSSDKHPECRPHHHIIDLVLGHGEAARLYSTLDQEIGEGQSDQIHQTVPAKLQGPQLKEDWADIRVGDCVQPSH